MKKGLQFYPEDSLHSLEFDKILNHLHNACLSTLGQQKLENQTFSFHLDTLQFSLKEVSEMKSALENGQKFPAQNYYDLSEELQALSIINNIIDGKQFRKILLCSETIIDIDLFFKKHKDEFFSLRNFVQEIQIDSSIPKIIDKIIDESGNIRSDASPSLVKIRKEINAKANAIHIVFGRILQNLKGENKLAETHESIRNGRRVLALQAESKRSIQGIIHDESDSGKTSFIEPQETVLLNNQLFELEREERREIHKILLDLSAQIHLKLSTLHLYQKVLAHYDLVRSKALLAIKMDANMPILVNNGLLDYKNAYHPLLYLKNKNSNKATVPFNLVLNKQKSILLISGPNAGGKSVTLKTVGLFQLMLQFGLLLPCEENSKVSLFKKVFTDLVDKQSIEDELSTYSSHLLSMKHFLDYSDENTLFLIDEFGTGTDPRFGAAMAEALLLNLGKTKAYGVITTHYSNLKKVAEHEERFLNGAMVFNEENLSPSYQLQTGKPGSSYTFAIAEKSGLSNELINQAKSLVDYSDLKFEELIGKVEKERKQWVAENIQIKKENQKLKELIQKFDYQNIETQKRQVELRQQMLQVEKQKNEVIETKVKEILNDINNSKSKEVSAQKVKELTNLRKDVLHNKEKSFPVFEARKAEKILIGDTVQIDNSDNEGEVLEIRGQQALVALNGLKTSIQLTKLRKIQVSKSVQKTYRKYKAPETIENTFDIRGLMQTEARALIEQYFDQALLNNLPIIKIIHGKGSGALRKQLQQLIKEYKSSISEWKYEEEKQGGNGATLISFK